MVDAMHGRASLDGMDEAARVRLAASQDAPEDVLLALASDEKVTVRAALAMNPAAPLLVTAQMARDGDERVRMLLGRRLAALIPSLGDQQRDRLQEQALVALSILVRDEAVRVRAAIGDIVKDMTNAPRDLILRLAYDTAMSVAEPVIRLSPLLTPDDLLALLAASPSLATATAVARRPGLVAQVAERIADSTDTAAIAALLSNPSATLQESTIDSLISRAADQVGWHEPLVRHRLLSARAARALADIVATHLVAELAARADLEPSLVRDLQQRLTLKLEPPPHADEKAPTIDEAMSVALALAQEDGLNEEALLGAAQRGEARMCTAILAVAADVPASVVDRACTLRSPKGLVSLVWKAGMTMRVAAPLQTLLVRLPPEATLRAIGKGGFPLAIEEMRWQIDFLTRLGR